jgi:hypothetical protein
LGIQLPTPPTEDKRNTSSAESQASTVATYHARTFSSASNASSNTVLTSRSSIAAAPAGAALAAPAIVTRKRSKSLSFSQYEKYLSSIDPTLSQPKFLKEPPPEQRDVSGQSLFSVSTRKSLFSIKDGIKRIRWKKKTKSNIQIRVLVPSPFNFLLVYAFLILGT